MKKHPILIIGKLPPPIGGVTIHISRLVKSLENNSIPVDFAELNLKLLLLFIFIGFRYKCIHIHSSNPFIRLYLTILSKIIGVKTLLTIHGNIGRYSSNIKNSLDRLTIRIADKPIVLNQNSLAKAKAWNNNTEMISAFIPPIEQEECLSQKDREKILNMKYCYHKVFCTNAYNMSFDKDHNEIYGIFELIEAFSKNLNFALIISDPSKAYYNEICKRDIALPSNIYIINELHSFYLVMTLCDASIRNTSTDGDSLSVKESLYLRKLTFVTDVVSRPLGCILYKRGNFGTVLECSDNLSAVDSNNISQLNGFIRLNELYTSYSKD